MFGAALWALASPAWSQVWVAPRRPGQSVVRSTRQDWQTFELLDDAEFSGRKAGGVRLFYTTDDEPTARRAAAQIEAAYAALVDEFDYVPTKRFDYFLYATYQEFLRTNLFPLSEGVLGVTATQGLHMAIPYFGEHQTFAHTSTHELAHEFTLQKVRSAARGAGTWRDPLEAFPLWFVEGLAEYRATGPLHGENALRVRDLVTNPQLYEGYGLLSFWDDWPGYTLWTYAAGHARITFLEQTYGDGTLNRLLDLSPAMVSDQGRAVHIRGFKDLVEDVTGDPPARVAERFDAWIKEAAFGEWLEARQTMADFEPLEDVVGVPQSLDASIDGHTLAYRSLQRGTGRSQLWVVDPRDPASSARIAADGRPGVESLHPLDPRNFDIADDRVAYVAEARGRDRLVVQALTRETRQLPADTRREAEDPFPLPLTATAEPEWRSRFRRGRRQILRLDHTDLVTAGSVALEPDGERLAFVGLSAEGDRDIYLATLDPRGRRKQRPLVTPLTDDPYAERDLSWASAGLWFASDASADGSYQIFRLDPDSPGPATPVTAGPFDHQSPTVLADGSVVFVATVDAHSQLWSLDGASSTVRLTDLPTGAFEPAPGPDGGVWSLVLHHGRLWPALLRRERSLSAPVNAAETPPEPPRIIAERDLQGAVPYEPLNPKSWGLDGGFAALGAGVGGVFGQAYLSFSDQLRDRALVLVAQAYGAPELTDAQLLYFDDHRRLTWGWGVFHSLRFRVDQTLPQAGFLFQSGERYYGGLLSVRYPFDRFLYLQADVSLGGVSYFLLPGVDDLLADPAAYGLDTPSTGGEPLDLLAAWGAANPDPRLQTEGTLRLGVDATRYHPKTGPVAGTALLLEANLAVQPLDDQLMTGARLDVQQYVALPLISGANLGLRASAGTSGGGPYAIGYWLSSYDTLRAFTWQDPNLLGRHFWFGNAELQVPLDGIIRLAVANGVEGVAGVDFGGVSDDLGALWDRRVLDVALGTNVMLGPLVLRLHFARALDVGAPLPESASPWVTNFSLSWLSI